ncbi:MAG: hypothetical protein GX591_11990 [Planctomycetes bacterium]|nr:hypothetical protein [Planctomycetota bacterium]
MRKPRHVTEAVMIGRDSWDLQHFLALPNTATPAQQVEALKADARWQRDHMEEIQFRIDALIDQIQEEA